MKIEARIAELLWEHQRIPPEGRDGWDGCRCDGGFSRYGVGAHRAHVAAALVAELELAPESAPP